MRDFDWAVCGDELDPVADMHVVVSTDYDPEPFLGEICRVNKYCICGCNKLLAPKELGIIAYVELEGEGDGLYFIGLNSYVRVEDPCSADYMEDISS